jgi:hypothetical protein
MYHIEEPPLRNHTTTIWRIQSLFYLAGEIEDGPKGLFALHKIVRSSQVSPGLGNTFFTTWSNASPVLVVLLLLDLMY